MLYRAIGPVWEANHVWLIFAVMLLANAFPIALAALARALWMPLLLALIGIVFRGAAYAFRSHAEPVEGRLDVWRAAFAAASTAAPFFLGASIGSVFSGTLQVTAEGGYYGDPTVGWLTPLSLFTAFYALGLCSYLAATFMTREAKREGSELLAELWRRRALSNVLWMGILSFAGLALVAVEAPVLAAGLRSRGLPLVVLSLTSGCLSLGALGVPSWEHCSRYQPCFGALCRPSTQTLSLQQFRSRTTRRTTCCG